MNCKAARIIKMTVFTFWFLLRLCPLQLLKFSSLLLVVGLAMRLTWTGGH